MSIPRVQAEYIRDSYFSIYISNHYYEPPGCFRRLILQLSYQDQKRFPADIADFRRYNFCNLRRSAKSAGNNLIKLMPLNKIIDHLREIRFSNLLQIIINPCIWLCYLYNSVQVYRRGNDYTVAVGIIYSGFQIF